MVVFCNDTDNAETKGNTPKKKNAIVLSLESVKGAHVSFGSGFFLLILVNSQVNR